MYTARLGLKLDNEGEVCFGDSEAWLAGEKVADV